MMKHSTKKGGGMPWGEGLTISGRYSGKPRMEEKKINEGKKRKKCLLFLQPLSPCNRHLFITPSLYPSIPPTPFSLQSPPLHYSIPPSIYSSNTPSIHPLILHLSVPLPLHASLHLSSTPHPSLCPSIPPSIPQNHDPPFLHLLKGLVSREE